MTLHGRTLRSPRRALVAACALACASVACKTAVPEASVQAFGPACNFLYPFLFNLPMGMETLGPAIALKAAAVGAAFVVQDVNGCYADNTASLSQTSLNDIASIVTDATTQALADQYLHDLLGLINQMKAYRADPVSTYAPTSSLPLLIATAEHISEQLKGQASLIPYVNPYLLADAARLKLYQERLRVELEVAKFAERQGDDKAPYLANAKSQAQTILNAIADSSATLTRIKDNDAPKIVRSWFELNKKLVANQQCYQFAADPDLGIDMEHTVSCRWAVCYDVKATSGADKARASVGTVAVGDDLKAHYAQGSYCWSTNVHNAPTMNTDDTDRLQIENVLMKTVWAKIGQQLAGDLFQKQEMVRYRKALQQIQQLMTAVVNLPDDQFFTNAAVDVPAFQNQTNVDEVTLAPEPPPPCGKAKAPYARVLARGQIWADANSQGPTMTFELTDLRPDLGIGVLKDFKQIGSATVSCIAPNVQVSFKHYSTEQKAFQVINVTTPGAEGDMAATYPQLAPFTFVSAAPL